MPQVTKKKKFTRSTSGCFTCRKRKKKCDGLAPICGACSRLGFECLFPEKSTQWEHHTVSSKGHIKKVIKESRIELEISQKPQPDVFNSELMEETTVQDNESLLPVAQSNDPVSVPLSPLIIPAATTSETTSEDIRPPLYFGVSPVSALIHLEENQIPKESDILKYLGDLEGSLIGNITVRSPPRSLKPVDLEFASLDLEKSPSSSRSFSMPYFSLEEDDNENVGSNARGGSIMISSTSYPLFPSIQISNFKLPDYISTETAENLLSYFCLNIATKFSICPEKSNSLVETYLPLAMENNNVLYSLLAWVSLHFEKNGNKEFEVIRRRLTLSIQKEIPKMFAKDSNDRLVNSTESSLAILLLLIAFENKQYTGEWVNYLLMAQLLVENEKKGKGAKSKRHQWLIHNLMYHEVTSPCLLLLTSNDFSLATNKLEDDIFKAGEPEAYMGIARPVYKLIGEIFELSKKVVNTKNLSEVETVLTLAEKLELSIDEARPLRFTSEILKSGTVQDHLIFFEALKDVSRLCIRQCVNMDAPVSLKTTVIVSNLLNNIEKLFGTVVDTALLFPLFILGVDTTTPELRNWILNRMEDLFSRIGSGNITAAIKLLKLIWKENPDGRKHIFWPEIAKEEGLVVSLA